jgi:hypothetical protein
VEVHGGSLTAENMRDTENGPIKGARFLIRLPAEPR